MVPQTVPPHQSSPAVFPAQDARLLHYQDVLAKMSALGSPQESNQFPNAHTPTVSDGWISEDDDVEEMKNYRPVKSEGIGPLLGGFADAESTTD